MDENSLKEVNDKKPEDGVLINRKNVRKALNAVPWEREQNATEVPSRKTLTDKLGGWKSDQYYK